MTSSVWQLEKNTQNGLPFVWDAGIMNESPPPSTSIAWCLREYWLNPENMKDRPVKGRCYGLICLSWTNRKQRIGRFKCNNKKRRRTEQKHLNTALNLRPCVPWMNTYSPSQFIPKFQTKIHWEKKKQLAQSLLNTIFARFYSINVLWRTVTYY